MAVQPRVSAWIIDFSVQGSSYTLSALNSVIKYSSINGYKHTFSPVSVAEQIVQRDEGKIKISDDERTQGNAYIISVVKAIIDLTKSTNEQPILLGIGKPGLKTTDLRGINVIANGPRMISYCNQIERELADRGYYAGSSNCQVGE